MRVQCPNCPISTSKIKKNGHFFRVSDSRKIQKYHCLNCNKHFSSATGSKNFNQNRRRLNPMIERLFCSGVSQRKIARILSTNRKTVARKLKVLGSQAKLNQECWLEGRVFDHVQFDDLETIEHTKLKPVSVPVFVSEDRKILGFAVARMPAKGHLAKKSRKKYGKRANETYAARERLCASLCNNLHPESLIETDEHPHYSSLMKKYFPQATHQRFKSERSCVSGQGELKKQKFDPLFKVNHTFAMLRYGVSRLIRRTWNTTKSLEALEDHLYIYMDYHNRVLT